MQKERILEVVEALPENVDVDALIERRLGDAGVASAQEARDDRATHRA